MPVVDVFLRAAHEQDSAAIADVHLTARREAMPYLPELHTDDETRAWFHDLVLPEAEVVVAEVDGRTVGFAALRDGFLEHLYVLPDVHGRGIGTALLAQAKELSPDGFRLWVFQRNADARRFYERRGFRLVELTDGAGNEEHEPDALYEWRPS